MSKRFEIIIVENGTRAVAELLEQDAPKICAALWNAMETPWLMRGVQAMWSGCEIILGVPEENRNFDAERVPRENLYIAPPPGSIGWIYFPPHLLPGSPQAIWNIPLLYGPNRITTPMGEVPVSIWARINEGMGDFAAECAKLQVEGAKTFRFERLR
jgi:hypothetical protein